MNRVRIVSASDEAVREPHIRAKWRQLLDHHPNTTLIYQSPDYFEHLAESHVNSAFLAIMEDDNHAPIGIVPINKTAVPLKFEVRGRCFAHFSFSGIKLLGGTLLAPNSPELIKLLFQTILQFFPDQDAIEISGVATNSLFWNFLMNGKLSELGLETYIPYGRRHCHTTRVPGSYDEYLRAFGHKKRYNLQRQVRRLVNFSCGTLELRRIDDVSAVELLENAHAALERSAEDRKLAKDKWLDLAGRQLLLSYVLTVKDKPCALAFGTRYRDTLILHHFRHDAAISHLSPGTVLQTLMMKDLADHKLAQRIDYGFGETRYRLTNDLEERATALLVQRGITNQSRVIAHRAFVELLDICKRLTRK